MWWWNDRTYKPALEFFCQHVLQLGKCACFASICLCLTLKLLFFTLGCRKCPLFGWHSLGGVARFFVHLQGKIKRGAIPSVSGVVIFDIQRCLWKAVLTLSYVFVLHSQLKASLWMMLWPSCRWTVKVVWTETYFLVNLSWIPVFFSLKRALRNRGLSFKELLILHQSFNALMGLRIPASSFCLMGEAEEQLMNSACSNQNWRLLQILCHTPHNQEGQMQVIN